MILEPSLKKEAVVVGLVSLVNPLIVILSIVVAHAWDYKSVRKVFHKKVSNSTQGLFQKGVVAASRGVFRIEWNSMSD
jgi:hypothetical protein